MIPGFYLRTRWLPHPAGFQLFVGAVLVDLAWRLLRGGAPTGEAPTASKPLYPAVRGWHRMEISVGEQSCGFPLPALLALALAVGVVEGTYGIGGGAIIAPFCGAVLRLPVRVVVEATLAGTVATSVIGVAAYSLLPLPDGAVARPDRALGSLFGISGLAGMYLGAAMQPHVPQRLLATGLGWVLAVLGVSYLLSPLI